MVLVFSGTERQYRQLLICYDFCQIGKNNAFVLAQNLQTGGKTSAGAGLRPLRLNQSLFFKLLYRRTVREMDCNAPSARNISDDFVPRNRRTTL